MAAYRMESSGMAKPILPNFTQWCRVLYQDILFPGKTTSVNRASIGHWIVVTGMAVAALAPAMGMPLFEPDETRYAQIPREMILSGDLMMPRLDGDPYFDKPPMLYWLVAGVYQTLGDSPTMARLVPAVSMLGTTLLTLGFGAMTVGAAPAFRAAMVLAICPGFSTMGRLLLMDGPLTLWIFLAQGSLFLALRGGAPQTGWWLLSAIASALGIMTKGPISLVLVLVPWAIHRWLSGLPGPGWRAWTVWWIGVLGLTLPWHVVVAMRDPRFLSHYLLEHHLLRFLQPFDHIRGTFFYVPVIILALFPLSFLLPWTAPFLVSTEKKQADARAPEAGYWFWCAAVCFVFFSLSGCKLPTYILPALAPLALLLAVQSATLSPFLARWGFGLGAAASLGVSCVALPWYAAYRDPLACAAAWKLVDEAAAGGATVVACYPRPCHAASIRLGRTDIRSYRSKDFDTFRADLISRPRTVVLCTHRHSLQGLKQLLPPQCRVVAEAPCDLPDIPWLAREWQERTRLLLGTTALGLCDAAVIEFDPNKNLKAQ